MRILIWFPIRLRFQVKNDRAAIISVMDQDKALGAWKTRTQEIAFCKLEILTSVSSLNNFMCDSNNVVREQENQVFSSNTPSVPEISNQTWTKLFNSLFSLYLYLSRIASLLQKFS
jgi:hypothetical protein